MPPAVVMFYDWIDVNSLRESLRQSVCLDLGLGQQEGNILFYHDYNRALVKTEAWIFYLQSRSDNIINRKQFSQCVPCQLFSVKLTRRHVFHGRRICWVKHSGKKEEIETGVTNIFRAKKPGKVFSRTLITLQRTHPEHCFKLSPSLLQILHYGEPWTAANKPISTFSPNTVHLQSSFINTCWSFYLLWILIN